MPAPTQESPEYVDISTIGIQNVPPTPAPLPSDPDKATVSYWMATTPPEQLPSSLDALPAQSDVVIIGSGITGVSCAYHLVNSLPAASSASRPQIASITIVEARRFCSGATGRNGGHLTAASALAYTDLAANPNHLLGLRAASLSPQAIDVESAKAVAQILNFEADTADALRHIIAEEHAAQQVGFTDDNNWHLCFDQAEVDAFEDSIRQAARHEALQKFVDQVRRVPKHEIDGRMHTPAGIVAVYEIPGATLHPQVLVSVLYKRAQRIALQKGISLQLVTDQPVLAISRPASHSILTTSKGEISAKYVVHATNAYASHLLPHLASATAGGIIPTRAQVVAVTPSAKKHLWGIALSAGGGYEYGHQRPLSATEPSPPLYILGGGREHATGREWGIADDTTLNPDVSAFLHPYLARVFPGSYGENVDTEWSGIMGYTQSKDPLVGPIPAGDTEGQRETEFIAAGYSGHGMTRAFGCAEAVASMIVAHSKGEGWSDNGGVPQCYLTPGAKRMLVEQVEEVKRKERDGSAGAEKEMKAVQASVAEDEKASATAQPTCCAVL